MDAEDGTKKMTGPNIIVDEAGQKGTGQTDTSIQFGKQFQDVRKRSVTVIPQTNGSHHYMWDEWCRKSAENKTER